MDYLLNINFHIHFSYEFSCNKTDLCSWWIFVERFKTGQSNKVRIKKCFITVVLKFSTLTYKVFGLDWKKSYLNILSMYFNGLHQCMPMSLLWNWCGIQVPSVPSSTCMINNPLFLRTMICGNTFQFDPSRFFGI